MRIGRYREIGFQSDFFDIVKNPPIRKKRILPTRSAANNRSLYKKNSAVILITAWEARIFTRAISPHFQQEAQELKT
jgi:hypothetical protein